MIWRYDTFEEGPPAEFHGDFLLTEGLVIGGSDSPSSGFIYAFEDTSGRVRWKLPVPGGVGSRVHRHGDLVLAVSLRGAVLGVQLEDGSLRWRAEGPATEAQYLHAGDSALARGQLFVPWRPGLVDAFDADTGELLWRRELAARLTTSAALFGGELVVGTQAGELLRLDPASGELLGAFDPGDPGGILYGNLVPAGDCLLVIEASGVNELLEPTGRSSVSCVRPSASEIRWQHSSEQPWTTPSSLVWGGAVVVGHTDSLQVLDLKDGTRSWEWQLDGTPRGVGALNELLYVGTRGGKLMALPWN